MRIDRRSLIAGAVASAALPAPSLARGKGRAVVVVGGGFAGATAARTLKRLDPGLDVTLVEAQGSFTACPFSNAVIAGFRDMKAQRFGYSALAREGVALRLQPAVEIDAAARTVRLADGGRLRYDRLILAPGVDFRWDAISGYGEQAAQVMPHAWKAGPQTVLLRDQLAAMEDGGVVVMAIPANPFRCPPGPYERASLIAWYLSRHKPRSKLVLLDAKDNFSKQRLFEAAWRELYPGMIEWVPLSQGGSVVSVDPAAMTLVTDFATHKADVANVIPPQKAGRIAEQAGVTDRTGWCPVDPRNFASTLQPDIHVIGDAAMAGAMPKSAFAANAQAKVCAAAVIGLMEGLPPVETRLINTCYSLVAPDYGISVAGVYRPGESLLQDVAGAGGISPLDAPRSFRETEAKNANAWFATITHEVFG